MKFTQIIFTLATSFGVIHTLCQLSDDQIRIMIQHIKIQCKNKVDLSPFLTTVLTHVIRWSHYYNTVS